MLPSPGTERTCQGSAPEGGSAGTATGLLLSAQCSSYYTVNWEEFSPNIIQMDEIGNSTEDMRGGLLSVKYSVLANSS